MFENISVRNLLLESRIDSSFQKELDNFTNISEKLQSLKKVSETLHTLEESSEVLTESKQVSDDLFKDSLRIFKNIKQKLREARDTNDLNIRRNRTKISSELLEDLKILVNDIEDNLYESVDKIEKLEKS